MKFNNVTMLEYRILFGELHGDKQTELLILIRSLNFQKAFPIVARLNHVVRENNLNSYQDELIFWFGLASPRVKEYSLRIENSYPSEEHGSLRLLNIWSNLALLQQFLEAYQNLNGNLQHDEPIDDTHDKLFKAYLLVNEIYVSNFNIQQIIGSIPNEVGLVIKMGFATTIMLLPYHDLNHIDPSDAMITNFIKAVHFFQFAEVNLPELIPIFLRPYGSSNWKDYFIAIFPLVDHALRKNEAGLGYLVIDENNPRAQASMKFLSNLSISADTKGFLQQDFILPRSKPLFQIDTNKYLVIDNLLVFNKLYNSLFFEFNSVVKNHPELFDKGNFKSFYNDNFSESYLSKQVLDQIFTNPKYIKFSGEEIRQAYSRSFNAEPDYYARDNEKVFLFELKDTFINGEIKQSFNFERIHEELKMKLWYKEIDAKGKTKIKPKAVRQLQTNIRRMAANQLPFDNQLEAKKLTIFPILLYIDQSLSTPGINDIVNQWFAYELANDQELGKVQQRFNIMPLTMIDLDTLILFQDDLQDGTLKLERLIEDFWVLKQELLLTGTQQFKVDRVLQSNISFSGFLQSKRKERKAPSLFFSFGKLLFDKSTK